MLWFEAFGEERDSNDRITVKTVTKVILFIYLLTREYDYSYPIAKAFEKALIAKKWNEEKGLTDVKLPGKVSTALNAMAERRLLLTLDEAKKRYPAFNWTPKGEQGAGRDRKYFTINPEVLLTPEKIELSRERRTAIIHWLNDHLGQHEVIAERKCKPSPLVIAKPMDKTPWESKSDAELLMDYIWYSRDYSDSPWLNPETGLFQPYLNYLSAIRFIQNYNVDPLTIIEYLNEITTKDYLTILLSAKTFAGEISHTYRKVQNDSRRPSSFPEDPNGEFTKIVLKEIKKGNWIFTQWEQLETARKKTFMEINPSSVPDNDPFLYIIPTDMMGFSMMLDHGLTYCIEQERIPHRKSASKGLPARKAKSLLDSKSPETEKRLTS